jgi:phosphoenolpyruvate carboxykinase (ATP)
MSIKYTRALITAALEGKLNDVPTRPDPVFGFDVPMECPGVPAEILWPRQTWQDPAAYDAKARELAARFTANFRQFEAQAAPEVVAAAPNS